jgi:hypothetical protein
VSDKPDREELALALRYACAEIARWRDWYGTENIPVRVTPSDALDLDDVVAEFLNKAAGTPPDEATG